MRREWGTGAAGLTELVRHDRIKVAVAAWAYENNYKPIMTDRQYDQLSERVYLERNIATGNYRLDRFFQKNFDPNTGLWVRKHPDIAGLENIYARYFQPKQRQRKRRRRR